VPIGPGRYSQDRAEGNTDGAGPVLGGFRDRGPARPLPVPVPDERRDNGPMAETVRYFHRTRAQADIARNGFRDNVDVYMSGRRFTGVRLADNPLGATEGGDGLVAVDLPAHLAATLDRDYEWHGDDKPYREWLVPAVLLNGHAAVTLVTEGTT
jgi:hypothetical protein